MITRLFILLVVASLTSCASVGVKNSMVVANPAPRQAPQVILVKPMSFYEPAVDVARSGEKLAQFEFEFQEKFTRQLINRLPKYVAPARPIAGNAPLPQGNIWVISGRFDRVDQGSRLLRSILGFGVGETKLDATITVSDLSTGKPRPFLVIQTTGGTNVSIPVMSLFRSGLTFDAVRTSREVTAALSEYLYQQGAFPYGLAIGPKRTNE